MSKKILIDDVPAYSSRFRFKNDDVNLNFCLVMLVLLLLLLSLLSLLMLPGFDFFRREGGCTTITDWDEWRLATVGMGEVFPLDVTDALLFDFTEDFLRFCNSILVLLGLLIIHKFKWRSKALLQFLTHLVDRKGSVS